VGGPHACSLLACGANPKQADANGMTALMVAKFVHVYTACYKYFFGILSYTPQQFVNRTLVSRCKLL
jgi:hypothetical protein